MCLPSMRYGIIYSSLRILADVLHIEKHKLNDRNGQATFEAIAQPPIEFQSPAEAFQQALQHEDHVTQTINRFYELAVEEKDYAIQVELQWFISEQTEEEKQARQILDQLKMIGDQGTALYLLDKELGERKSGA